MNEWINIEDKLPADKQKVKFKGKFNFIFDGFFENGFCEKTEDGHSFYYLHPEDKKKYSIYGVTHWMPLPPAPKEK